MSILRHTLTNEKVTSGGEYVDIRKKLENVFIATISMYRIASCFLPKYPWPRHNRCTELRDNRDNGLVMRSPTRERVAPSSASALCALSNRFMLGYHGMQIVIKANNTGVVIENRKIAEPANL